MFIAPCWAARRCDATWHCPSRSEIYPRLPRQSIRALLSGSAPSLIYLHPIYSHHHDHKLVHQWLVRRKLGQYFDPAHLLAKAQDRASRLPPSHWHLIILRQACHFFRPTPPRLFPAKRPPAQGGRHVFEVHNDPAVGGNVDGLPVDVTVETLRNLDGDRRERSAML